MSYYDEEVYTEEVPDQYWDEEDYPEEEETVTYHDPEDKVLEMGIAIKMYIQDYMEKLAVPIGNSITTEKVDKYVRGILKH